MQRAHMATRIQRWWRRSRRRQAADDFRELVSSMWWYKDKDSFAEESSRGARLRRRSSALRHNSGVALTEAQGPSIIRASGLKWIRVGAYKPANGEAVDSKELAAALQLKIELEQKTEFSETEWDAFNITDLRSGHYVKVVDRRSCTKDGHPGTSYFQAAFRAKGEHGFVEGTEKATFDVVDDTVSRNLQLAWVLDAVLKKANRALMLKSAFTRLAHWRHLRVVRAAEAESNDEVDTQGGGPQLRPVQRRQPLVRVPPPTLLPPPLPSADADYKEALQTSVPVSRVNDKEASQERQLAVPIPDGASFTGLLLCGGRSNVDRKEDMLTGLLLCGGRDSAHRRNFVLPQEDVHAVRSRIGIHEGEYRVINTTNHLLDKVRFVPQAIWEMQEMQTQVHPLRRRATSIRADRVLLDGNGKPVLGADRKPLDLFANEDLSMVPKGGSMRADGVILSANGKPVKPRYHQFKNLDRFRGVSEFLTANGLSVLVNDLQSSCELEHTSMDDGDVRDALDGRSPSRALHSFGSFTSAPSFPSLPGSAPSFSSAPSLPPNAPASSQQLADAPSAHVLLTRRTSSALSAITNVVLRPLRPSSVTEPPADEGASETNLIEFRV